MKSSALGIYIHWPFCRSKCPYCDFYSSAKKCDNEDQLIEQYCEDLQHYRSLSDNYQVQSIFFGGGTPSLIKAENIEKIINQITKLWPYKTNLEMIYENVIFKSKSIKFTKFKSFMFHET